MSDFGPTTSNRPDCVQIVSKIVPKKGTTVMSGLLRIAHRDHLAVLPAVTFDERTELLGSLFHGP